MITIVQADTKKRQKEFIEFPLKLYKGNDCFVPPLYGDEKKLFTKNYVYYDTCEAVYYIAYKDGKMVGRIQGILQKAANEKYNQQRVRFSRFDSIDDQEVATALFNAVEDWAKSKGMNAICGPLGFSDLEREGLLIEGFDELSTFEEQYNYDYYQRLIENCGYVKEVDWLERKVYLPEEDPDRMRRLSDVMLKRLNLHFGYAKNTNDFIKRYGDAFFDLLDEAYEHIYGTVPFTEGTKKMMISNFKIMVKLKHTAVILDEEGKLVCLGLIFPSLSRAVQPSGGRLTPLALLRILKALRKPKILDMALIGVKKEYANKGVSTAILAGLVDMLKEEGVEYAETNLNLETNVHILNQWRTFKTVQHKRRRSFVKEL